MSRLKESAEEGTRENMRKCEKIRGNYTKIERKRKGMRNKESGYRIMVILRRLQEGLEEGIRSEMKMKT